MVSGIHDGINDQPARDRRCDGSSSDPMTTTGAPVLTFACTACGRCCQGLRLPLSIREARDWSAAGGVVELFCEAAPDLGPPDDPAALHRWASGFAGVSGTLPIRVRLMLVAAFDGPCPRLLPDMRCGAYAERPSACRIYPAEMRPDRIVDPAAKLCPPEAWSPDAPPLIDAAGRIVDEEVGGAIAALTDAQQTDAAAKAALAQALGLHAVALANEGSVVVLPDGVRLRAAIDAVVGAPAAAPAGWRFVTDSADTAALIVDAGGESGPAAGLTEATYRAYVSA